MQIKLIFTVDVQSLFFMQIITKNQKERKITDWNETTQIESYIFSILFRLLMKATTTREFNRLQKVDGFIEHIIQSDTLRSADAEKVVGRG